MKIIEIVRQLGMAPLDYLIIEGGNELKTIGITQDCVCGYYCALDEEANDNEWEDPLWSCYYQEHIDLIPKQLLEEVKEAYTEYLEYHGKERILFKEEG